MPEAIPLTSTLPIVDGVTDLNGATLNQLEIAAKKGAANGYAPLDATSKVPIANLPPVSGVDYIGPWAAGTAFKRGDVVKYLGNDYLAVNDSTGVVPPAPVVPPLLGASYGTSLPASPFDGQEAILVDSLTNPTYQWRFRYNAGSSSAYKWEFVGGSAAYVFVSNAEACAAINVWTNLATVGPDFVVPRTGDYRAQFTCYTGSPGSVSLMQMGIANASVALTPVGQYALSILPAGGYLQLAGQSLLPGIVGGQTLRAAYQTSVTNMSFGFRTLSILPARVA